MTLTLASDRPCALVAARLCDVAPNGVSTLVTVGALNLTHRESHEHPTPLVPGRPFHVTLRLKATSYAFPPGHRIRLALSPTLWPWAWPSPEPATLTVSTGGASALLLPVRQARPEDDLLPPSRSPKGPQPLAIEIAEPGRVERTVRHDLVAGRWELAANLVYFGSFRIADNGLEYSEREGDPFAIVEGNPLSAEACSEWSIAVGRGDWQTRVETSSRMTADAQAFRVTNSLDAYEGETHVFAKNWAFAVPRDLV